MIFDYIFLLPDSNDLDLYLNEDQPQNFIIPVSIKLADDKGKLFERLYRSDHKFCFKIESDSTDQSQAGMQALVNLVTSFLFLPSYVKHNGQYVLLLDNCPVSFKNKLKEILQKQLVTEINIVDIDTSRLEETNGEIFVSLNEFNCYLYSSGFNTNPANFITDKIQASALEKKWIIRINSKEDFSNKISRIKQFERLFFSINPLLTTLITESRSAKNNYVTAKAENDLLRMKLKNTVDNLKALRDSANGEINYLLNNHTKGESDGGQKGVIGDLKEKVAKLEHDRKNIQEWYDKEYEILPLWYKRFGHVIKVFKRKRSMKSLFK